MVKVLVTNDDGFLSPGLRLLYSALSRIEGLDICVVVPEKPQSAGSLGITLHKPIRVWKTCIDGIDMYVISGRPCDAVIYAFSTLGDFDIVISGVNIGDNTGLQAVLASGTISPCIYASIVKNIPGISFSILFKDNVNFRDDKLITIISEICRFVIDRRGSLKPIDVISINLPHRITRNTKAKVCDISEIKFTHYIVRRVDPRGLEYFWIHGYLTIKPNENLDVYSLYVDESIVISGLNARYISTIRRDYDPDRAYRILLELCNYVNDVLCRLFT